MKTKRNIAICGLTLVMCVSLLAGVTFAWFTDSITNSGNTISSGDLKINAYAYDLGEGGESYTINETVYSFEADVNRQNLKEDNEAVITGENWYPGQSSAKMFTVENVGSLDADVSLDFFVSGGLTEALWFDFIQVGADGSVMGQFVERPMETLPALAEALGDVEIASNESISFVLIYGMEKEAQNEYMNQSFQVNVFISAKQTVEGAEGPVVVNPGTDLSEVVNSVADNSTIVLAANGEYEVKDAIDLSGKKGIVIDGNGATITMGTEESGASYSLAKAALAETKSNSGEESILNIAGAENVIIRNLTVEGAVKHGLNIYLSTDVLVENVVAKDNGALGICVNGSEVTLKDVTTSGNAWGGVNVDNKGNIDNNKGTTSLTVDEACSFGEYLQIYADSVAIADAVKVNAAGYTRYNVTATNGEEKVLWTNNENVVEGAVFVDNATNFDTAVAAGGNVIFANDIEANLNGYSITKALSINLNNFTLTSKGTVLPEGSSVVITNGKIDMSNSGTPFCLMSNAQLELSYLTVNSDYTVALVGNDDFKGENAKLVVDHCNFTVCDAAAITTNANKQPWSCEIIVTNSNITCDSTNHEAYPMDNCPIYMNVAGNLTIDNCVITGQRQGVMVRTGTAKITNTTIINTGEYIDLGSANLYLDGAWGSGNDVPMAALVVGNRGSAAYSYATNVTVENCALISEKEEVPAIYVWGNSTEEAKVTLTFDKATYDNMQGNIDGVLVSTETSKVQINAPVSLVSDKVTLNNIEKGGDYILADDIIFSINGYADVAEPTKTTTLNLNGKTIKLTDSTNANIFYALASQGGTLTIVGNGVIDASEADGYAVNVYYGFGYKSNTLVINGGTYIGATTAIQIGSSAWGAQNMTYTCFITGGVFKVVPDEENGYKFTLNCIDNSYSNGTAKFVITGGSFFEFDPSNSTAEPGGSVNWVADGYKVVTTETEEGTWYTVVPETAEDVVE